MENTAIPNILSNQFFVEFTAIYEVLRAPGVLIVPRVPRVLRVLKVKKYFKSGCLDFFRHFRHS